MPSSRHPPPDEGLVPPLPPPPPYKDSVAAVVAFFYDPPTEGSASKVTRASLRIAFLRVSINVGCDYVHGNRIFF